MTPRHPRLGEVSDEEALTRPANLLPLFVALGVIGAGDGLVLPYLVIYLHLARGIALATVGLIVGFGAAASFLVALASGAALDRIRPIRVFQIGTAAAATGFFLLSFVSSALAALLAVLTVYIGTAIQWPAQNTVVGANVTEKSAGRAFAGSFLALNAGLGIGALASALFVNLAHPASFSLAYRLDAAISLGGVVLAEAAFRKGRLSDRRETRSDHSQRNDIRGYGFLLRDRAMVVFVVIDFFLLLAGYAQLEGGWNAFAAIDVGVPARVVGLALAANTGVIVIAQIPMARLVVRFRRSRAIAMAGTVWTITWILSLVAVVIRRDGSVASWILILAMGTFGFGETLYSPVVPAITNALAPESLRGRYNAAANSIWSLAAVVAPPIAAFMIATGNRYLWVSAVAATAVVVVVAVLLIMPRVLPRAVELPPSGHP